MGGIYTGNLSTRAIPDRTRIRTAIAEEGLEGLLEKSRSAPRIGNRVLSEVEEALLEYSLQYPTHGQARVSNELKKKGIGISAGGVRSVWLRHNLHIKKLRLQRLEKWAAESAHILTESQIQALEDAKVIEILAGLLFSSHSPL